MSTNSKKSTRLEQVKRLLLETETGLTPTQLAKKLEVDRSTIHRDLSALGDAAENLGGGLYRYRPTGDDVDLAVLILRCSAKRNR